MERAPARFGPSVSALLRGLSNDAVTIAFSWRAFESLACDDQPKKLGAIILALMMARKISGGALLGRHHLYVSPRSKTGKIRTTARNTTPRENAAVTGRSLRVATRIIVAAMKVTG
jgi:hypothetical protein